MFKICANIFTIGLILCSLLFAAMSFAQAESLTSSISSTPSTSPTLSTSTDQQTSTTAKQWIVCLQPYVLCAHARCTPIPDNPNKARCTCTTKYGYSTGNETCDKRKVMTNAQGQKILMVAYSFAEMETNPMMTCGDAIPWAHCLNTLCKINLQSPSIAHCICDIKHKGGFQTQGGHCKLGACNDALWAGVSASEINAAQASLAKQLGMDAIPIKRCPTPADLKIENELPT